MRCAEPWCASIWQTKGLSLLENAAHIGLPVPQRLKDVLAQLHKREDKDNTTDPGE